MSSGERLDEFEQAAPIQGPRQLQASDRRLQSERLRHRDVFAQLLTKSEIL